MQVNKIQSPSFGRCIIHKSAIPVLERMSDTNISKLFSKASTIQDTKFWDLQIRSKDAKQFFMKFINKEDPKEYSFCNRLIPCSQQGNTVSAIANDSVNPVYTTNIYHLEFENDQRAQEIFTTLNTPEPQSNMDIIDKAVETIKILEEASSPKPQYKKLSFFDRLLNWLQK